MFKIIRISLIFFIFVILSSSASAVEYVLCDFEDSTIYSFQSRWVADNVRWIPDPTGRSNGVMAIKMNSGYKQPDYQQKGYIHLINQYLMNADSIKLDLWVPSDFPATQTNPWMVLFILYGGQWCQHSSEGVYLPDGPTGGNGWPDTETWFTLTMNIDSALAEGPGNISEEQLLKPFSQVGLFIDWLGTDWEGEIYLDNFRFVGVEHPVLATKPDPPTEVVVIDTIPGQNTVEWIDETLITSETYNIFVSSEPITDVTAASVQKVASGIAAGQKQWTHRLFSTGSSESVSYYYAVTSQNWFGNSYTNPVPDQNATSSPVTNTTIALAPIYYLQGETFTIDGSLEEYNGLPPFHFDPDVSRTSGNFADAADYSADIWVVLTDTDLIVGADITDDQFNEGDQYFAYEITGDIFSLYLGFYEYFDVPGRNYLESDAFRISYAALPHPVTGWEMFNPFFHNETGENVKVTKEGGWILEFRIPYSDFMIDFTPCVGMTLPIDFNLQDADGGNMTISDFGGRRNENNGTGLWFAPCQWAHTEIWDRSMLEIEDNDMICNEFRIAPAFPNPFNRSVTVMIDLPKRADVDLSVYDITGRKVANIFRGEKDKGKYRFSWNGQSSSGKSVSSGIYFLKLKSDNNARIQKVSFLK
ncbi:MAG: hypothetical protein DRP89_04755 [Candidatus Neomarinimicrobiota bacterium]|nr:MAG: hypothetical protein DRP89_04755 [Candidatus Neomarinimicrobiota bacterium]